MPEEFFRELRGEYVENAGQVVTPRQFLDYLEPLGSALSRLPDGVGGPFVYQFRDGGGRVIGALGWVVSAASKRYGGWNLWGVWTDGPIPAVALPLLWPELGDRRQLPALLRRANDDAEALQRRESSPELLDNIAAMPLHNDDLRTALKIELTRLYRAPFPDERPLEIELSSAMLELLPWVYLLGPVEPGIAQLQPSRFNGAGYQYILNDAAAIDGEIADDIDRMVDAAAGDVLQGYRTAAALRERRARPRTKAAAPRKSRISEEPTDMGNTTSQPAVRRKTPTRDATPSREPASSREPLAHRDADSLPTMLRAARDVIIIVLLAWIAWNVHQLRKEMTGTAASPAATVTETRVDDPLSGNSPAVAGAAIDDSPAVSSTTAAPAQTRNQRLAAALLARPPQGIRVQASASNDLPHAAVEIFIRRNNCFPRTEPVDGRFSAAEQKAVRNCTSLTTQRLMRSATEPHTERALDWLETALAAR